ncbi:MAG: DUF1289 domain-containing protein [Pseudomonadales bacterium]
MTEQTQERQDQEEMFHTPNPCVGVCTSGPKGYCKGCLRSRDERFYWQRLSENQKHRVVQLCHNRKQRILAARTKREQMPEQQEELFASDEQLTLF